MVVFCGRRFEDMCAHGMNNCARCTWSSRTFTVTVLYGDYSSNCTPTRRNSNFLDSTHRHRVTRPNVSAGSLTPRFNKGGWYGAKAKQSDSPVYHG
jgi:hypothetical protein